MFLVATALAPAEGAGPASSATSCASAPESRTITLHERPSPSHTSQRSMLEAQHSPAASSAARTAVAQHVDEAVLAAADATAVDRAARAARAARVDPQQRTPASATPIAHCLSASRMPFWHEPCCSVQRTPDQPASQTALALREHGAGASRLSGSTQSACVRC